MKTRRATSRRQRRMAFAESCHFYHCAHVTSPQRQSMMRHVLNKFDWGIGSRRAWMKKLWKLV